MKTIAKTTKKAKAILDAANRCVCYSLSNNFTGHECEVRWARNDLYASNRTKLRQKTETCFTVKVHSNLWYDVYIPEGAVV